MKLIIVNIMAAGALLAAASAAQAQVSAQPSSLSADLPLTPQFSAALEGYRDCVLSALDQGAVAAPRAMVSNAMNICAATENAVRAQLQDDIRTQNPATPEQVARAQAQNGMAAVEPIIAQVALAYARDQIGQRVQ